ncbi:MAG: hypothetical protein QXI91_05925 [Candidatus Bathyarchaeia archaeon]
MKTLYLRCKKEPARKLKAVDEPLNVMDEIFRLVHSCKLKSE